jgi:flagellar FliL protein
MKKNLISIVILALLVVNLLLSALTAFSVISTNQKTAAVIAAISNRVDLAASGGTDATAAESSVSMENTSVYDIADSMTIPLTLSDDGTQHYYVVNVSLSMNTQSDGYSTYGADIATKESLIKSKIIDVIGGYTLEEIQADPDAMKAAVLKAIQNMFNSDFIYQVSFSNVLFQ